jgi:hypothetical protein
VHDVSGNSKEFLHSLHPLLPDEMRVRQTTNFRVHKIPCCTLLKDVNDEQHVLKLNDSGILIWQLCQGERSIGDIVDLLADAFEQEREEMARDVSRVVSYLIEENAVAEA